MNYSRSSPNSAVIDSVSVQLPGEILTEIALSDRVALLVDPMIWSRTDPEVSRNVFCYGSGGRLLWRIEPTGHVWRENGVLRSYYSYLALWYRPAGDELWAASLDWEFLIDKDTGKRIRVVHNY